MQTNDIIKYCNFNKSTIELKEYIIIFLYKDINNYNANNFFKLNYQKFNCSKYDKKLILKLYIDTIIIPLLSSLNTCKTIINNNNDIHCLSYLFNKNIKTNNSFNNIEKLFLSLTMQTLRKSFSQIDYYNNLSIEKLINFN